MRIPRRTRWVFWCVALVAALMGPGCAQKPTPVPQGAGPISTAKTIAAQASQSQASQPQAQGQPPLAVAGDYDFVCDITTTAIDTAGQEHVTQHVLAIRGTKTRVETVIEGGTMVNLTDTEAQKAWNWMLGDAAAQEVGYDAGRVSTETWLRYLDQAQQFLATTKPSGRDNVGGQDCVVIKLPVGEWCIWEEEAIPLRIALTLGPAKSTEEWTNCQIGDVPDELFEPPSGG